MFWTSLTFWPSCLALPFCTSALCLLPPTVTTSMWSTDQGFKNTFLCRFPHLLCYKRLQSQLSLRFESLSHTRCSNNTIKVPGPTLKIDGKKKTVFCVQVSPGLHVSVSVIVANTLYSFYHMPPSLLWFYKILICLPSASEWTADSRNNILPASVLRDPTVTYKRRRKVWYRGKQTCVFRPKGL